MSYLQLIRDVPEEEDAEDAELQASIASANKWRKMAALTRQRAAEVLTNALMPGKINYNSLLEWHEWLHTVTVFILHDKLNVACMFLEHIFW